MFENVAEISEMGHYHLKLCRPIHHTQEVSLNIKHHIEPYCEVK